MPASSDTQSDTPEAAAAADSKRSTGVAAATAQKTPDTRSEPAVVRSPQAPATSSQPSKEEPELRLEPSIPSDGKDEDGERLMEQLGRERREKEGAR